MLLGEERGGVLERARREEREPGGLGDVEGQGGGRKDTGTQSIDSQLLTELYILTLHSGDIVLAVEGSIDDRLKVLCNLNTVDG